MWQPAYSAGLAMFNKAQPAVAPLCLLSRPCLQGPREEEPHVACLEFMLSAQQAVGAGYPRQGVCLSVCPEALAPATLTTGSYVQGDSSSSIVVGPG